MRVAILAIVVALAGPTAGLAAACPASTAKAFDAAPGDAKMAAPAAAHVAIKTPSAFGCSSTGCTLKGPALVKVEPAAAAPRYFTVPAGQTAKVAAGADAPCVVG